MPGILEAQIILTKQKDSNQGRIMRWLKKNGPATYALLSYELALRYDTVEKHVNHLREDGLVNVEKQAGPHKAQISLATT